jgi:DNA-binding SARP family transcriptional activator/ABC-type glycerol-3-phosphate transport system substrate-binding protein
MGPNGPWNAASGGIGSPRRRTGGGFRVEIRVLGPIEVIGDRGRITVGSGRQLALLAFLVGQANRVVSADRILDAIWGDEPPASGAKSVAFHVSRLRDALEPGRPRGSPNGIIATEAAGYVLRVEPDRIDAVRFERLVLEGRAALATDPETARPTLETALALWRGEPYADVADESFVQPEIRRLDELHLVALEERLAADLALGRHAEAIEELQAIVARNPLRERLRGQLMVALYRAGRQAEALRTYGEARRVLADELGVDPGPELQQLQGWILRQDPRLEPPARRRRARNPYKGLRAFEEQDSPDFFGRESLVARLTERLGQVVRAGRLLTVVGPSGSGKSSVVRAGLIPAMRAGALPGSDGWSIAVMQPGARPFRELAAALRTAAPNAPRRLEERLERDCDLTGVLAEFLPAGARALLVIDQLEELFALVEDEDERSRFVGALVGALAAREGRLVVVATLRADWFSHPLRYPALGELVRNGIEVVTPLSRDELEHAIVRPAEAVGVQLEAGLATELIADVTRQPGALPLLQYALTELFERSDGQRLGRDGYAAIGGVLGALGGRAEEVYAGLDVDAREVARQVFLRLVAPGESNEPTARRVPQSELRSVAHDGSRAEAVLDAFDRGRLLSFDLDRVSGEPTAQIAHEALLGRWPRLAGWIERAREDLWTRRRLADAAADWIRSGRDPGFLLTGSRRDLFATWATSTDLQLDRPERELLDASAAEERRLDAVGATRAAHERALERRAKTQLRVLVVVFAVAAIVATSVSLAVYGQGEAAREQSAVAAARELAAASIGNLGEDPALSLLLAWHGANATVGRGYVVEEVVDALNWALQAAHVAYPPGEAPVAVRSGPGGPRGVMLLPPNRLMALAAISAGRGLTPEECRTYLHREDCPTPSPGDPSPGTLGVSTGSGVVAAERLASGSLAGARVEVAWGIPADPTPIVAALEARTGIDIIELTGPGAELGALVESGDLPDVAVVARPADVADLARAGLLVELSALVDVEDLRAYGGDYLVGLGTLATDGTRPAPAGRLYGATFALEAKGLVWYPKAAFERAGYDVPQTWTELQALAARIVADGGTPWCLGLESGARSGSAAADFLDEIILGGDGPEGYDRWATGALQFGPMSVTSAFEQLGTQALQDGYVLGGISAALRTPEQIAGWPMFVDPPGCWLHLAGAGDRPSWPAGGDGSLAAFPFPASDPAFADAAVGRAFMVVVFHDRPEVRRFVNSLVGDAFRAELSASFDPVGIRRLGASDSAFGDAVAQLEVALLAHSLASGAFRVDVSDLAPASVASAIDQGALRYLSFGPIGLAQVVVDINHSWHLAR